MPRRKNNKSEPDHAPGAQIVAWTGLVLGALALLSLAVFGMRHDFVTLGLSMVGSVAGSLAAARAKKHPSGGRQVAFAGLAVSGLALVIVVFWMMAVAPDGGF